MDRRKLKIRRNICFVVPDCRETLFWCLGTLLAAFTALAPVIAALAVSFGGLNIFLLLVIGIIAGGAAAIAGIIAIAKTGEPLRNGSGTCGRRYPKS